MLKMDPMKKDSRLRLMSFARGVDSDMLESLGVVCCLSVCLLCSLVLISSETSSAY
jgi:hypothetical protein